MDKKELIQSFHDLNEWRKVKERPLGYSDILAMNSAPPPEWRAFMEAWDNIRQYWPSSSELDRRTALPDIKIQPGL